MHRGPNQKIPQKITLFLKINLVLQSWPKILAHLVNMIKEGGENYSALLILLIFFYYSYKSNLSLDNKNLKWGKYDYEIKKNLKNTSDTIIGTPRNY